MKLDIKHHESRNIQLYIPTSLLLNPVSIFLLRKAAAHKGIEISQRQARALAKTWKQCRKSIQNWKLLEAESSEGDFIEILP